MELININNTTKVMREVEDILNKHELNVPDREYVITELAEIMKNRKAYDHYRTSQELRKQREG